MLSYLLPKGSHSGTMAIPSALDEAVATLPVDFTARAMLMYTHGFGYPGMCKKLRGVYEKKKLSSPFLVDACVQATVIPTSAIALTSPHQAISTDT